MGYNYENMIFFKFLIIPYSYIYIWDMDIIVLVIGYIVHTRNIFQIVVGFDAHDSGQHYWEHYLHKIEVIYDVPKT